MPMYEAQVIGEADLSRKLSAYSTLRDSVEKVLLSNAFYLRYKSMEKAPVKTGHLEGSITLAPINEPNTMGYLIGTNVPYAYIQEVSEEFHHPIKGQAHYFSQSMEEVFPKFKQELESVLNQY